MAVRSCDLGMSSLDSLGYEESLPMDGKPSDQKVNDVVSPAFRFEDNKYAADHGPGFSVITRSGREDKHIVVVVDAQGVVAVGMGVNKGLDDIVGPSIATNLLTSVIDDFFASSKLLDGVINRRGIDANDNSLEEFGSFHSKEVAVPKEPNNGKLMAESFGKDHGHRETKTMAETVVPREENHGRNCCPRKENHDRIVAENCDKVHGHVMGAHVPLHELCKGSSVNIASRRIMLLGESLKGSVGEHVREGHGLIDIPLTFSASLKEKAEEKDEAVMDALDRVVGNTSSLLQSDITLNSEASDTICIESLMDNAIINDNSLREILEVTKSDGNDEGGKFSEMSSSIDGEHSCMQEGQAKCFPQIPYMGYIMDSVGAIMVEVVANQLNDEGKESMVSA
ncbi:hypothetical protein AMTR_s00072p00188730 [Amborella trichopoda]|uniref:Uncharacterized protein n=1 Tax=Amborella trichopoda TaxID=13333 RepID=W1NRJ6_AMBTC|nr:hypothetical protein AMTR_s00072p00188730 [Amborella trichopoda]